MKRLLIRADDLGYSEGVNCGIEKSVKDGLIRSVGIMSNMPAAVHGMRLLAGCDVALGQHTNISNGVPAAGAQNVPSLVDERTGMFKSSREYRAAAERGEDLVTFDDAICEAKAQLRRFRELVGKDPDYFECHAVLSRNFFSALEAVAAEEHLKLGIGMADDQGFVRIGETSVRMLPMRSMMPGYDATEALKDAVALLGDGECGLYVCHPGYIDADLLASSSLTEPRVHEVATLCNPGMRDWLANEDVELIDYRDL